MHAVAGMQERWKGLLPDLLGIEFTEVGPERVRAALSVRPELCTLGGVLHGGALMAFADTLGAVVAFVNLPPGARTTTLESKTNFIGAAASGTRLSGESAALHKGRTTMVCQTTIRNEGGKLLALVTQTQLVIPA